MSVDTTATMAISQYGCGIDDNIDATGRRLLSDTEHEARLQSTIMAVPRRLLGITSGLIPFDRLKDVCVEDSCMPSLFKAFKSVLPCVSAPDQVLYEEIAEFTGNKEASQMLSDVFTRVAGEAGKMMDGAEEAMKVISPLNSPLALHCCITTLLLSNRTHTGR
jgi:hypothetical protein